MTPRTRLRAAPAYGGSADGFGARLLTPAMVGDSELVLTATEPIRSPVLEDSPPALRRTATEQRSRGVGAYDVPDPDGRGDQAHLVAAQAMAAAVGRIAARFNVKA